MTRIVFAVVLVACIVALWRMVAIDAAQNTANQIDYEDAALCTKFGLVGDQYQACKLDLLDLRHNQEQLVSVDF